MLTVHKFLVFILFFASAISVVADEVYTQEELINQEVTQLAASVMSQITRTTNSQDDNAQQIVDIHQSAAREIQGLSRNGLTLYDDELRSNPLHKLIYALFASGKVLIESSPYELLEFLQRITVVDSSASTTINQRFAPELSVREVNSVYRQALHLFHSDHISAHIAQVQQKYQFELSTEVKEHLLRLSNRVVTLLKAWHESFDVNSGIFNLSKWPFLQAQPDSEPTATDFIAEHVMPENPFATVRAADKNLPPTSATEIDLIQWCLVHSRTVFQLYACFRQYLAEPHAYLTAVSEEIYSIQQVLTENVLPRYSQANNRDDVKQIFSEHAQRLWSLISAAALSQRLENEFIELGNVSAATRSDIQAKSTFLVSTFFADMFNQESQYNARSDSRSTSISKSVRGIILSRTLWHLQDFLGSKYDIQNIAEAELMARHKRWFDYLPRFIARRTLDPSYLKTLYENNKQNLFGIMVVVNISYLMALKVGYQAIDWSLITPYLPSIYNAATSWIALTAVNLASAFTILTYRDSRYGHISMGQDHIGTVQRLAATLSENFSELQELLAQFPPPRRAQRSRTPKQRQYICKQLLLKHS